MRDVVLIVLDTLRYDYSHILDPVFQKFGLRKSLGISTSPWTLPSHVSFFTGLMPSEHRVFEKYGPGYELYFDLWATDNIFKDLKMEGYEIHFISANPFISEAYGFAGFERSKKILVGDEAWVLSKKIYQKGDLKFIHLDVPTGRKILLILKSKDIGLILRASLVKTVQIYSKCMRGVLGPKKILEKGISLAPKYMSGTEQVFLFINLMEAHEPYLLHNKPSAKGSEHLIKGDPVSAKIWKAMYAEAVKYISKKIPAIISKVIKLLKNPLLVVVSDHGQLLGEYGNKTGHGLWLYNELVHVPVWSNIPLPPKLSLLDIPKYILAELGLEDSPAPKTLFFSESYGLAMLNTDKERYWRISVEDQKGNKVVYNVDKEEVEWGQHDKKLVGEAEAYAATH